MKVCEFCKEAPLKKKNVKRFCSAICYHAWGKTEEGKLSKQLDAVKGNAQKSESLKAFHKLNPEFRIGEKNPSFGIKRDDLKIRNVASKGKVYSTEQRRKFSNAQKLAWEEGRRVVNPSYVSKPEHEIANYLRSKNLEVVQQFRIKGLRWVYDIYIPKLNLVIEYNGSMWHCNPTIYQANDVVKFPGYKYVVAEDVWKKDLLKKETIEKLGYRVEIVWDDNYKKYKFDLLDQLIQKYYE